MQNEQILTNRLKESMLCPLSSIRSPQSSVLEMGSDINSSIIGLNDSELRDRSRCLKLKKDLHESMHPLLKDATKVLLAAVADRFTDELGDFCKTTSGLIVNLLQDTAKVRQQLDQKGMEINDALQMKAALQARLTKLDDTKLLDRMKKLHEENQLLSFKSYKLQNQLEQLKTVAQQPQNQSRKIETCNEKQVRQMESKVQEMHAQTVQLKLQKDSLSYINNTLRLEIARLKDEIFQAGLRISELKLQITQLNHLQEENDNLKRFREMFQMCRQEKDMVEFNAKMDCERLKRSQALIRKLRQKLLGFSSLIGKGNFNVIDSEEKESLDRIKECVDNNEGFKKASLDEVKNIERFDSIIHAVGYDNLSPVRAEEKIYMPSFFCLYDEGIKEFQLDFKIGLSRSAIPEIFLKLRAIFDSKFNQYLLEGYHTSKFPDFVYGFLERFDVDPCLKKIIEIDERKQQISYRRKKFIAGVFHPRIEKHNQVSVFREFLLGNPGQDEIFYYLNARNLLMKGPQLENYISASDCTVFINFDYASKCMGHLLARYTRQAQNSILYHINLKKRKKFGNYWIDGGYVLRALLQIYRSHRKQKLDKLKTLLLRIQQMSGNSDFKFSHFRELIELNFCKMPITKIAEIFRQAIALSKGNDKDFSTAFIAVASSNIFLMNIKEEFRAIRVFSNDDPASGFCSLNSATLATLGLESLMTEFRHLLRDPSVSIHTNLQKWMMLDKVILLLYGRKQFGDDSHSQKISKFKTVLREDIQRKGKYLAQISQNRVNKDMMIKKAGHRLTRTFGLKIKAFYNLFVKKINDRIDVINAKNLYAQG